MTPEQTKSLDDAMRNKLGTVAFKEALRRSNSSERPTSYSHIETTNRWEFPQGSIPLGKVFESSYEVKGDEGSAKTIDRFKPDVDEDKGTTVAYVQDACNMTYTSQTGAGFVNPDAGFFGPDNAASPEELSRFFADPDTHVVEALYTLDDEIDGQTAFSAARTENGLNVYFQEIDRTGVDLTPQFGKPDEPDLVAAIKREILHEN